MNGVLVDSYPSGQSYFYGHGAGGLHTSSAILSDLLNYKMKICLIVFLLNYQKNKIIT